MQVNKDTFLRTLEAVQYGVAQRETVALSKAFILQKGEVITFDDEVMCRSSSGLPPSISGAVEAQSLLEILRKIPDTNLYLKQVNGEVIVKGDRREATFRLETLEDELPSDQVESPGEWKDLPPNFGEAIKLTRDCAKENDPIFSRTCVHITKKFVEAYDNFQMLRYKVRMDLVGKSVLIRKEAVKGIANLGMTHFCETDNWIHFKNQNDLVYSCRRWLEAYPDLDEYFSLEGEPVVLPKGLSEIVDRAQVFTQQMAEDNRVKVEIKKDKVVVVGVGITGGYKENSDMSYKGKECAFLISPALLTNIVKNHQKTELALQSLIARDTESKWIYVAYLNDPDEVNEGEITGSDEHDKEEGETDTDEVDKDGEDD